MFAIVTSHDTILQKVVAREGVTACVAEDAMAVSGVWYGAKWLILVELWV